MPFIGILNNETVIPEDIEDGVTRYLYDDSAILGDTAEPTNSSLTDSTRVAGCSPDGHVWEPYGEGVLRCARCSARKAELTDKFGTGEPQGTVLPMEYMGNDLTELTADPKMCNHDWECQGETYQCERCGLIDEMPF